MSLNIRFAEWHILPNMMSILWWLSLWWMLGYCSEPYFTFVKLFVRSILNIDVKSTTVDTRCRRCFEMSLTVSSTTSFRDVVNCVVTDPSNRHCFIIPLFVSYSGSVTCPSHLPLSHRVPLTQDNAQTTFFSNYYYIFYYAKIVIVILI